MTKQGYDSLDRPALEITPAMIEAGVAVFVQNGDGTGLSRFTVWEIRDLLPEAFAAAFGACSGAEGTRKDRG
jgi:hypothetical protein